MATKLLYFLVNGAKVKELTTEDDYPLGPCYIVEIKPEDLLPPIPPGGGVGTNGGGGPGEPSN